MKKTIAILLFVVIICAIFLTASLRGNVGNPTSEQLNNPQWQADGPFGLSPERGRFALTYSMIEDKSFYFSLPIAKFAVPDLGYKNGHYVSLFAPGVSFLVIPGYVIGKLANASQLGTFAIISLFAIGNVLLIIAIGRTLRIRTLPALVGGLTFLFASPAFSYAVTLYQHHVSTFLILLSIYILVRYKNLWSLGFIWFLFAMSIPVDYPNLFLMLPIAVYALGRLIVTKINVTSVHLSIKLVGILTFLTVLVPLSFFLWFNKASYGNPLQFSGTVASVREIDATGKPTAPQNADKNNLEKYFNPEIQEKSAVAFFKARNLVNGLYLHIFSPDRGIIFFTPVMLLGLVGMYFLYKQNSAITVVCVGVIMADLLLYSLWSDPWGGWAFGSRYMIPGYAMLSIFLAIALSKLRKNILFLLLFLIIFSYSAFVNTAGALSTDANPPQVEVLELEKISGIQQKYTFERNLDFLKNSSKSFIYQSFAHTYVTSWQYFQIIAGAIIACTTILVVALRFTKEGKSA